MGNNADDMAYGFAPLLRPFGSTGIAVIAAWFLVILSYYLRYGRDLMPLGWDACYYMAWMMDAVRKDFLDFLYCRAKIDYRVLYPLIGSLFVRMGVDPAVVEIFFPIFLSVILIAVFLFFTRKLHNRSLVLVLTGLYVLSWCGLYRMVADHHANMLAMVLFLLAVILLLDDNLTSRRFLVGEFLIFLSSISHPTVSVLTLIFVASCAIIFYIMRDLRYSVMAILTPVAAFPSFLSLVSVSERMMSTGINIAYGGVSTGAIFEVFLMLGVVIPIFLLGFVRLVVMFLKNDVYVNRKFLAFLICWSAFSILSATVCIFLWPHPNIKRFLMLAPTPVLMAEGTDYMLLLVSKVWRRGKIFSRMAIYGIITGAIICYSFITVYEASAVDFKTFNSPSAYERLKWVASNLRAGNPLVFVMYGAKRDSVYCGELGNNLIIAAVGDHYTYLGRIDFFVSLMRNPFLYLRGERMSARFYQALSDSGLLDWSVLKNCTIIIIEDFYLPHGPPEYYRENLLEEMRDGVYVLNFTKLLSLREVFVPLYYISENNSGGWYWIRRDWAESGYVAECYDGNPGGKISYYEIFIAIPRDGDYTFRVRYRDGTAGCGFYILLNGMEVGRVVYNGTGAPIEYEFKVRGLKRGVYRFTIMLYGRIYYASLDYLMYDFYLPIEVEQ